MEVFVLLAARLLAITHTFAFTVYGQNASLIAKLALPDLHPAFVLVLKREFWRANFDNNYLVMELLVFHSE
jgi:hypothetical protein